MGILFAWEPTELHSALWCNRFNRGAERPQFLRFFRLLHAKSTKSRKQICCVYFSLGMRTKKDAFGFFIFFLINGSRMRFIPAFRNISHEWMAPTASYTIIQAYVLWLWFLKDLERNYNTRKMKEEKWITGDSGDGRHTICDLWPAALEWGMCASINWLLSICYIAIAMNHAACMPIKVHFPSLQRSAMRHTHKHGPPVSKWLRSRISIELYSHLYVVEEWIRHFFYVGFV